MSRLHANPLVALLVGASLVLATAACAPARQTLPAEVPASASPSTPTSSPAQQLPTDGDANAQCSAAPTTRFVGQALDADVEQQAKAASGARSVRVVRPGMAVTMDYRYDRLNVEVDDAGRILRLHCG